MNVQMFIFWTSLVSVRCDITTEGWALLAILDSHVASNEWQCSYVRYFDFIFVQWVEVELRKPSLSTVSNTDTKEQSVNGAE